MKPAVPAVNHQLHGIHYFVDGEKSLQAYEYASYATPDLTAFQLFLDDFCRVVSERGLQQQVWPQIQGGRRAQQCWMDEFEFHRKRGTIMLQDGMPMPDGDSDYTVKTEWGAFNMHPRRYYV